VLRRAQAELEDRVRERTAELAATNAALAAEVIERQRAEAARERLLGLERAAREEVEGANRSKDEFLATLSHELRTPLSAMLGWTRLIRSGSLGPDELAEALDVIERNGKVQVQIVDDLLDMGRIISGKLRIESRPVHLAAVVVAAIETVLPTAETRGIRIETRLDRPATPVLGDAARLQQVVWILLTNAIKFSPKGGRVAVGLRAVDSQVEVVVRDDGQGIAADFLPHVFERFRQADGSSSRAHGGLGLGLSIVRHLVELHGGTVRADSPGIGRGASFTVRLPVAAAFDPAHLDDDPTIDPSGGLEDPSLAGVRVLVVEDEPDARALLRRLLEGAGAVVVAAGSVAEALAEFDRGRPDVVVSDIGMSGRDGFDLIRAIRALEPARGGRTPAAALSAFAQPEDRRRALLSGFQTHIAKPVDPADLIAVVASLAGRTGGSSFEVQSIPAS